MRRLFLPLLGAALLAGPVAAADPPTEYRIPYRLTDTKHVLVRVKLNGKGPFNLILDTGAPAVFIPNAVAKKAGVALDRRGWGTFDAFEIEGGVKVAKAQTRVEDLFQLEGMNGLGLAGVELHGVIGYNVLAKFRVTYDFAADKLLFAPLKFDPPAPVGIGRGGQGGLEILGPVMKVFAGFMGIKPNFETQPRGFLGIELKDGADGVVIAAVLPDGPAAKAGLKADDAIEAVGVATGEGKARLRDTGAAKDLEKAIAEARSGDELSVKYRRGDKTATVTVTLGKGL